MDPLREFDSAASGDKKYEVRYDMFKDGNFTATTNAVVRLDREAVEAALDEAATSRSRRPIQTSVVEIPEKYGSKSEIKVEIAAGDSVMHVYAETEALNPAAMNEMLSKYGVTNKRWGDAELATFEKAWNEVVAEESAKDAWFKEISDSYFAFRKEYRTWGTAQSLDSTYLK